MARIEAPSLKPAVFDLVGRENPNAVASLQELQERVEKFCKAYATGLRMASDAIAAKMGATPEESIQLRIGYIQVSIGRRLTDLLRSIISHINDARLLDLALCARACIELSGAIVFYEKKLTKLFTEGISTREQKDKFNDIVAKATRGGRFDWARWLLKGPNLDALVAEYADKHSKPTSPVQVKNVSDFVQTLDKIVAAEEPPAGLICTIYALLSDICHPAVGGYMLYLSVPQPAGYLSFDVDPNQHMASWLIGSIISPTTNRSVKQAAISLQRLKYIAETVTVKREDRSGST